RGLVPLPVGRGNPVALPGEPGRQPEPLALGPPRPVRAAAAHQTESLLLPAPGRGRGVMFKNVIFLADWSCQRVGNGPTAPTQPVAQRAPFDAGKFGPFLDAERLTVEGDELDSAPLPAGKGGTARDTHPGARRIGRLPPLE